MPEYQIDTKALAQNLAIRIRKAAEPQLNEVKIAKVASVLETRKERVDDALIEIDAELTNLSATDRASVEGQLGVIFEVPGHFKHIIKEASLRAIGNVGTYWGSFHRALGLAGK